MEPFDAFMVLCIFVVVFAYVAVYFEMCGAGPDRDAHIRKAQEEEVKDREFQYRYQRMRQYEALSTNKIA